MRFRRKRPRLIVDDGFDPGARLKAAGLVPPIRSIVLLDGCAHLTTTVEITDELEQRVSDALDGLTFSIEQVEPGDGGVFYGPSPPTTPA